jgi:glutamate/tyrosine decarboxylase-like PLP-dependent enzyme
MNNTEILHKAFGKIEAYIESNSDNDLPVVKFKSPGELSSLLNFSIADEPVSQDEFLENMDKYLDYSVRTGNKQFLNQLYSGFNFPAFLGEVFTVLANTSMYTYEVAPVATMIEKEMISLMNSYAGYTHGDGIFLSGGSNANLIAMFSARNRKLPETRFQGYQSVVRLKAFINEQAHYSFETAANLLGIGSKNVVKVKADENGRMIPSELEKEIRDSLARNEIPFFVAATCATTLLGAYDPIDELSEICRKYNLWLHADGSFGGSVILSDTHRSLMSGIEKTDSFAWNPHKLMNIPLICSVLLVKDAGTLQRNLTDLNTDYIFHDIDEVEDLGKKSVQCGRKVDAVKLWFAWKYFGKAGYRERIDNLIENAVYAEQIIKNHPSLELMVPRQSFSVCFRYLPDSPTDLNAFNLALREEMRKNGLSIVNYGYRDKILMLRLVITNGEMKKTDVDLFFERLTDTGKKLEMYNSNETENKKTRNSSCIGMA